MRKIRVSLGERSYTIQVGPGLLDQSGQICARALGIRRCAVITDVRVAEHHLIRLRQSLRKAGFDALEIMVPAGEKSKSLKQLGRCFDQFAAYRLERRSAIIALGGGVVGDLAGFAAASYLRGIDFVQIPTTLLAQVDSSVGGKTGVNLKAGKNLVGAFHQPKLVLCDLDTLATLPDREFRAGLAEVIKYGVIYDEALFRRLERDMEKLLNRDTAALTHVVTRSCQIKADVVEQDEREGGLRAILNFGHTIGHAIEAVSGYGSFLHGEAIAIGQVAAAKISSRLHGLSTTAAARIEALFQRAGLPTRIHLSAARRVRLLNAMRLDKKVSDGEITFVLADRIGHVAAGVRVPQAMILEALD